MSLRFIGSLRLTQRVAIATALAAVARTSPLYGRGRTVTALLRGGERVTGRFDGFTNGLIHIDVSDTDERKIPVGDVALIDLVGAHRGCPKPNSERRGRQSPAAPQERRRETGRLVAVEGAESNPQPTTVVFRTPRVKSAVCACPRWDASTWVASRARRPSGVSSGPTHDHHPRAEQTRHVARRPAVDVERPHRRQGAPVAHLTSSGEVQLSTDPNDTATTAGSKIGRRLSGGPMPGQLAGALIGRVGNGQAFGSATRTARCPCRPPASSFWVSTTTTSTTTAARSRSR